MTSGGYLIESSRALIGTCSSSSIRIVSRDSDGVYIKVLLAKTNQRVESVNTTDDKNKEIVDDLISIITSFCGKIYDANRKAKTMRIIHDLENSNNEE